MNKTIQVDERFVLDAKDSLATSEIDGVDPYAALRIFLDRHDVPRSAYCIGSPDCDQKTCLHFENDLWVTYFSERGARTNALFCTSWIDAVKAFGYGLSSIYANSEFPRIGQID